MIVHHIGRNGEVFEGGQDFVDDPLLARPVPRPWFRINGHEVTNEEFVAAWRAACDHKFIDSRVCVKCGWVPPDDAILTDAEGSPLVISGMHGLVKQWKADYEGAVRQCDDLRIERDHFRSALQEWQARCQHAEALVLSNEIREATMARLRQIITLSARVDTHNNGRIRELAERALTDLSHLEAK